MSKPEGQAIPVSAQEKEIGTAFGQIFEAAGEIEELELRIEEIRREKAERMTALMQQAREDGFPEREGFLIAALYHDNTNSAERMQENLRWMVDVDEQVKDCRGEAIVWLSSKERMTKHVLVGENEYATENFMHMGIIGSEAQLEVGRELKRTLMPSPANLSIPVDKEIKIRASFQGYMGIADKPLEGPFRVGLIQDMDPPELQIKDHEGSLAKATLLIGNEAVEQMIEGVSDLSYSGRKSKRKYLEEIYSTLRA